MSFMVPIGVILIINAGLVSITKHKFGECIPITLIVPIMLLYISQYFFSSFRVAYVLLCVVAAVSLVSFFFILHHEERRKSYFSFGFFAFLMICAWYAVIDWHRSFSVSDELSFWGMMVREMLRLDRFYSVADSALAVHKDYPPFFSLFEMFFCKFAGGFREDYCSMAVHIFSYSLLIPGIELKNTKTVFSCVKGTLMLAFSVLLVFSLDGDGIAQTIYLDYPMAIVAASAVLLIFLRKVYHSGFYQFVYSLLVTLLLMGKQIGIFYFFLSTLFLLVTFISDHKVELKKIGMLFFSGVLFPFLWWISWKFFVHKMGANGQFDLSKISLYNMIDAVANKDYVKDGINGYVVALANQSLNGGSISITFLSSIFLVSFMLIFLQWIYKEKLAKNAVYELLLVFDCGAVVYAALMLVLYILCFAEIEFANLMSFPRYMGSYVAFELLMIFLIFCNYEDLREENGIRVSLLAMCFSGLAVLNSAVLIHMEPQVIWGDPNLELREVGVYLDNNTEENSRIYVVDSEGRYGYMQTYFSHDGRWIDPESTGSSDENIQQDVETFDEKIAYVIDNYDYIWIASIHEQQKMVLQQYISDEKLQDNSLVSLKH